MTYADAIADWLAAREIRCLFGVIGAGNLALWDAITRKGATEIVCVHHEQAAALAANGYYRASGRLALCLVTTGGGSSNALTGVLSSHMDSIPLLVISGNESASAIAGNTRVRGVQGYDSSGVAKPITKWAARMEADDIPNLMLDAFRHAATTPRMGACWLDVPSDVQRYAIP